MSKKITAILSISLFVAVFAFAAHLAIAAKSKMVVNVNPSNGRAVVKIPAKAVEVAPGVFSLGTAVHNGEVVEGYAIFKYKENPVKVCGNDICEPGENERKCPQDCGGGDPEPDPEPDTSSCYGFLAKGAKWKTVEPYIVNPANTQGMDEIFVVDNFGMDVEKWETAAQYDILGDGSATSAELEADLVSPDDQNEVYFGSIEDEGAIAVTIVWGVFGGPPQWRKLVEWDQVYDEVDFSWSATGEADKMDFENIATHELGHSTGLSDLYNDECSAMTMYGYASEGETNKRDLEDGDINGIMTLY